jgi:hypothetical protein
VDTTNQKREKETRFEEKEDIEITPLLSSSIRVPSYNSNRDLQTLV